MSKTALIVLSPTPLNINEYKSDINIGVEKGCLPLIKHNMLDVSISDFDHVTDVEYKDIKKNSKKHIELNSEKDLIDGEAAIAFAINNGYDDITCIFESNNRVDMQLSLIGLIDKYNVKYISSTSLIFKLTKKNILKYEQYKNYKYVSIMPLEDSRISIKDMKYECENYLVEAFSSQTFSNELIENKDAIISVIGKCIIIFTND